MSEQPEREPVRHAALSELRHNLRTPINHVLGYTEMLIEDASEIHNAGALELLRQIHSTARGALTDVNAALSNRDSVEGREIEALYEKIRPRADRIQGSVVHLREDPILSVPPEWVADLDRVSHAAESMLECFGTAPSPPAEAAPPPSERRPNASSPRLLVVDDNSTNRNVLCRRLERQGYITEQAANGHEALDRIAAEEFDVVLLDILMPGMDGFEVLERIRRGRRTRTIPVVVISAVDESESVVRAIEMGAEDYLFKPFDPVLLRARIGALIERKRLAGELAVQAKLASLGALTAGIAHEIKNPLNFIINFAGLAQEAADEQVARLEAAGPNPPPELLRGLRELAGELRDNVAKIREHGARADSIVAGMLAHSRGEPGEWRPTDINALVRDYVNLAFHGTRARDNGFQVSIETIFDPAVGLIEVVPQDLSRVFLNVASNACDAVREKAGSGAPDYQPVIRVATRSLGESAEIRIRDNGIGIPSGVRDRVFDPFFTTKAAGEGTGLGLSISYDIVVQEHRGEMRVESREGEFTEVVIAIPRRAAEPS